MPLPFLKPKHVAGIIIQKRAADGQTPPEEMPEDHEDQALEAAAEDLIRAVHAKDGKSVAAAFRAAFDILESEPHEEAPHPGMEAENEGE